MSISLVEIGLSFLEGLALIASPCILPVLPLVLAGSVEGGRKRPFGIIVGFVVAFTLFALLSRQLVATLHLNLDYIKYASLLLLALFGLILLSKKLSLKFSLLTQRFANMGSNLSTNAKEGFFSGLFIGVLIGLVWTPCAGPILAAVLVQIIRQQSDLQAFFLIASFAVGAGIPMLVIALLGRKIVGKLGFFTRHAETIRKAFGVIILLAVILIASGVDIQSWLEEKREVPIASTQNSLIDPLSKPYQAPEFPINGVWINSPPLTMAKLKGKVVLIDFWTYSCINCIRTLPFLTNWDSKYRDKGLVIIGVHAPEFEFEKNKKNVENAIATYHINYPVVLDNNLDIWTNFNNRYWPAHYLIDQKGRIIYTHFGEGDYGITENNIRTLLSLNKMTMAPDAVVYSALQTPETYLGSARQSNFSTGLEPLPLNHWRLLGKWRIEEERIVAEEAGAKLQLHFNAGKVFLVMGAPKGKPVEITIKLNGKLVGKLLIDQHKLYTLINQQGLKQGLLEITATAPRLEAYAFTFGE
ncbi:cytochrome c biogenesis protein DipZ [Legionella sp. D16C41]|uniref:cytochrome c biogenesis protein DipZ n=1 Tax=Legionella sp. D16C41 TaxID=3402688 RepID=UPI003AF6AC82